MKVVKFALIGATGFAFDAALFYVLLQLGMETMMARLLAFWLTATFTWYGNKHLTFQCKQQTGLLKQWAKHMFSAHFSGLANLGSFYLLTWFYPLELAFTVGVIVGAVLNYWLSDKFVFDQGRHTEESGKAV